MYEYEVSICEHVPGLGVDIYLCVPVHAWRWTCPCAFAVQFRHETIKL